MKKDAAGCATRRSFIAGAGAAAISAGVAGVNAAHASDGADGKASSSADAEAVSGDSASAGTPSFLTPPDPVDESEISETIETDVLIIGAGIAGISAARAATEAGARVTVIEKSTTYGLRSSKYGPLNSSVHKRLGQPELDPAVVVNELQKDMGYRGDQQLLMYWGTHSGEDFDWWLEPVQYDLLMADTDEPPAGSQLWIKPTHWPHDESYDWLEENCPCVIGELAFVSADQAKPGHIPVCEANAQVAIDNGAQFIFCIFGRYLEKEGDRVAGAIAQYQDGRYVRIKASKGVILTCGDFSNNHEMMEYYVPWAAGYQSRYNTVDCNVDKANTGDGHLMGMWAGAVMEDGPLAPMTHNVGNPSCVGVDPYLLLNLEGERFMNEDVNGQAIENALVRQTGRTAFQFLDANWVNQLNVMPCGMANMTNVVPDDQYSSGGESVSVASFEEGCFAKADTIDELLDMCGYEGEAKQTALASIERYNELAAEGRDEDFGKVATRLFPLDTPPFYAVQFNQALILVLMGGLVVDHDSCQALDAQRQPIPGLYVAGNTMGGRFLVDYPTVVQGISHSSCMTFGRLAGTSCANA